LASNPRLVKEFETLKHDYACFVLCFKYQDWSLQLSEEIRLRNPEVHFIEINRHKEVLQTLVSKIVHKMAIAFNGLFIKHLNVCAFASNDKTFQLWSHAKLLMKKHPFNRVIAHNVGAFYPALRLSERTQAQLQLDIEDYYPGEAVYSNDTWEVQNRMYLMAQSFSKADVITYASEGIFLECETHFSVQPHTEKMVLINAFKAIDFIRPEVNSTKKMTCVWFSQYIAQNRGLESVFQASAILPDVEFHIIGNSKQNFVSDIIIPENIIIHDAMEQTKLHAFLSSMDIGLALEPGKDLNNTIALSNKMIAYAQAGCYILATDTFGQTQFLNSLDFQAGEIIHSNLAETLQHLDKTLLDVNSKTERWHRAKSISWEHEQLKLKTLLK